MTKRMRFAAVCGAALLIAPLIFSAFFVAAEADHDCSGDHCTICHQVQICQVLLEQLSTAHAASAAAAVLCFFTLLLAPRPQNAIVVPSPVLLRVKLLN